MTLRKTLHALFDISVILKAVDGVLEILGGIVLLLVRPDQIHWVLQAITLHELGEDPNDAVATFLLESVQRVSTDTQMFAAFFLLWHGLIKVGLVVALLRRQLWAYPTAIVAFGLFLTYQLYRYSHTGSVWLLALSVLDLFVIALTWLEYRRLVTSRMPTTHVR